MTVGRRLAAILVGDVIGYGLWARHRLFGLDFHTGAGPRICIGLSFALSEAQMVMAQLLSRYKISLPDVRPVLPVGRVTVEPSYVPLFRLDPV